MQQELKAHIRKFTGASDEELAGITTYFKERTLHKKENLLREGETCKAHYFVVKGILRKFFMNEKAVEHTTEFAVENWWMTDTFSLMHHTPSGFYIQAVEKTLVLTIHQDDYDTMLEKHPVMEKYFRCIYQKAYAAVQMRIRFQYEHSREALYHHFRSSQPGFLQRVPQYLIASYLGFTPEYLSEIRKKNAS